ncbi:hypothetical protein CHELA40_15507 [Chelatococcus asaccharovorans]|nr:hypothetical protein CHELA17_60108 [Chelatococcus asaccharovorans]CAH1682722.1 hypothetical protein CHELA40_15507 [Chelatococcus asaccharovorans]
MELSHSTFGLTAEIRQVPDGTFIPLEQIRLRWNRFMPSKPMNLLVIF